MKKLSLLQMSEFIESLANMQRGVSGLSAKTFVVLEPLDSADLCVIAAALRRMAPYADSIRRMIVEAEKANG